MVIREYTTQDKDALTLAMYRFQEYLVDIDDLKRLRCNPGYGEAYTADLLEKVATQDGIIFVAEEDGKIIGLIAGIIEPQTELDIISHIPLKHGRVVDLFIEEESRGSGVGKQLMTKIEDYFQDKKCDAVMIEVFGPNKKAKHFYEQLGYSDRDYDLQKTLV